MQAIGLVDDHPSPGERGQGRRREEDQDGLCFLHIRKADDVPPLVSGEPGPLFESESDSVFRLRHRRRDDPARRIVEPLRTGQLDGPPVRLDRAAAGGEDVAHPVAVGAVGEREDVAPAVPEDGTRPMPMGLQMTTPLFTERALLGYAHAYERATRHAETLSLPETTNA